MPEHDDGLHKPHFAQAGERRYRLLGLTLETSVPFQTHLLSSPESPDLRFRLTHGNAPPNWPTPQVAAFESPTRIEGDLPLFSLHRNPDADLLRFPRVADYLLTRNQIHGHLLDPDYAFQVETHFLGMVLSYWLEREGIPVLHASTVSVADRAVAFLGTNKAGKSSLALSLMRRGHALLSDDLVGLQLTDSGIEARPGFPSMRMWPDLAEFAVGKSWEQLPLAHPRFTKRRLTIGQDGFGQFQDEVQPLACLYIPHRLDDRGRTPDIRFEPVPPGTAIFEILRQSFLPWLSYVDGFTTHRLKVFSALAKRIPVRRLFYPGGFHHLEEITERIVQDIADQSKRDHVNAP